MFENIHYVDRLLRKEDYAEAKAKFSGMDDGPSVQVLQRAALLQNPGTDTFPTENACLQLLKYCRLLRREKNSTRFQDTLSFFVAVLA